MRPFLRSLLLLLAWGAWLSPVSVQAQGTAFSCDGTFYQTRQVNGTSQLFKVDRSTATYTTTALNITGNTPANDLKVLINGLAYNPQDGFMYALSTPGNSATIPPTVTLYKIGQGGIVSMGTVKVGTANLSLIVSSGSFDKTGHYYFTSQNTGTADYNLYTLDLNSGTPLVATTKVLSTTGNDGTFYDIAYNPIDNFLYGVNWVGSLFKINQGTGTVTKVSDAPSKVTNLAVGTLFFDVSGSLYGYNNGTTGGTDANFYQIDLTDGSYTTISPVNPASVSDGASCINPDQRIDVTKEATNIVAVNATTFNITYTIRVRNSGTATDNFVQVSDLLFGTTANTKINTTFPTASSISITSAPVVTNVDGSSLAVNSGFTGINGNASLLTGTEALTAGQRASITYTVQVVYPTGGVPNATTPQNNTAYATSTSSGLNQGYSQASDGSLLTPNALVANDASTNTSGYPDLRINSTDTPSPTPVTFVPSISGVVFEDVNYGGGLGRTQVTSLGVGRAGARVELYTVTAGIPTLVNATTDVKTTASDGSYSFTGLATNTSYVVRVVNSSVTSSRTGASAGLLPVQTYRTTAATGTGTTADLNRVGGEDPARGDAGNGGTGSTTTTLTTLTAGNLIGTIPQSQASVVFSNIASPAVNVSFGYNFDLIVNTNNAGQGSLRQFVANSNALGDEANVLDGAGKVTKAGLAQVYTATTGATTPLTPNLESSIFMIPNGTAVAGQRASLTSGFAAASGGTAATITLLSALPTITGSLTALDGSTQTNATGNTNAAASTAGAESTGPEVIVNLNNFTGLAFSGSNEQLLNLGVTGSAAASSGVLVNGTATGLTVRGNTLYSNGANVSLLSGATGNTIATNVIRSSTRADAGGIVAQSGTSNNVFSQNIFNANTGLGIDLTNGTTANGDGVTVNASGTRTGANSLFNFPVLTTANIGSTNLVVSGYARPGALVELYLAAADPTQFGEGVSYLTNFAQGAAVGTVGNVTTGSAGPYGTAAINGLSQGTDNTNTFTVTIPLSSLTAAQKTALQSGSAILTSTATGTGIGTSEFSGNLALPVADVTVSLTGPTTLYTGQATGTYTATFTNEGPNAAATIGRVITLPAGASLSTAQKNDLKARYTLTDTNFSTNTGGATVIDFGNVASLTTYTSSAITFAFTAPSTVSNTLALTANTSTASSEGADTAPDQAVLTLRTVATADVTASISAAASATTGTFTATFGNSGSQDATAVVPTVQLPAGLVLTGTPANWTYTSGTGLLTYNSTPTFGATTTTALSVTISYLLSNAPSAPVTATASVSTATDEAGSTANNVKSATMSPQFDLTTTLTGPTAAIVGSPTTLYVTTTNNGPNTAGTATQTVTIVSATSLAGSIFITNGGTYSYSGTTGTVTFPALANVPSGQTITNSISFLAPSGTFTPTASVTTTSTTETSTTNNTANLNGIAGGITPSTSTTLANEATTIVATVGTTTTPATVVNPGSVVTYTVTSTNKGYVGTAPTATVTEKVQLLPGLTTTTLQVGNKTATAGSTTLTFAATNGIASTYDQTTGVLTYSSVTEASGVTTTYPTIAVTAPANVGNDGQLVATASVSTDLQDNVPADNVASVGVKVRTTPDLTATVTGPGSTAAGLPASYVVRFTNSGATDAVSVTETAQLPAGLSNVVVTDANGAVIANAYNSTSGQITFAATTPLITSATQLFTITLAAPGQTFPVVATIASATADGVPTNNSASQTTTVTPNGDLAVNISGPATAVIGNTVTYIVATTNNGPTTVSNAVVKLQLPTGLTLVGNPSSGPGGTASVATSGGIDTYTFATIGTLVPGGSTFSYINFTMPNASSGQISGVASVSSSTTDLVASNNTSALTTSVAPATTTFADLRTSISLKTPSGATSVPAGTQLTYTIGYRNAAEATGAGATATAVMPTASLPAGLSASTLQVAGSTGSLSGNVITFNNVNVTNATYNVLTGLLTFPTIASAAPVASTSSNASYEVSFPAPVGSGQLVVGSQVASATSDNALTNNYNFSSITVGTNYDVTTTLAGPQTSAPGTTNTYTVTSLNNGPSPTASGTTTTQTVTLPANVTATSISGGGSQSGNVITWSIPIGQAAGAANEVVNSFSIVMPATGNLSLIAQITSTGETATNPVTNASNSPNNTTGLTTNLINIAPVAQNVWNTLQSARSNDANTATQYGLPISPLNALDSDGSIGSYTIVTVPPSTQGALYYNGETTPVVAGRNNLDGSKLTFAPNAGFVGNATFTYLAVDNGNGSGAANTLNSPVAIYTIPVAADQEAPAYTPTPAKGGLKGAYVAGDVIAYTADPNTATYVSNGTTLGVVYSTDGRTVLPNATNGITSATTPGTLTKGARTGIATLSDLGLAVDANGRIVVNDPGTLASPKLRAGTYEVSITTIDANGGVTTQLVGFTIPSNPLPVVLTAFTASAAGNRDAKLSWTTASEINSAYFDLERSFDGTTFAKIGQVAAQGTTTLATTYAFTDAGVAARATGAVYYRLKQVDLDATASYSPVRTVSFTKAASLALSLYPNPAQASTKLDLSQLPATSTYRVVVLDATGRLVRSASFGGGQLQDLDLHELASGTYHVLVTGTLADGSALRQTLRLTKE